MTGLKRTNNRNTCRCPFKFGNGITSIIVFTHEKHSYKARKKFFFLITSYHMILGENDKPLNTWRLHFSKEAFCPTYGNWYLFQYVKGKHNVNTRHAAQYNFKIPKLSSATGQQSFSDRHKIVNSLPSDLRKCNLGMFKEKSAAYI